MDKIHPFSMIFFEKKYAPEKSKGSYLFHLEIVNLIRLLAKLL